MNPRNTFLLVFVTAGLFAFIFFFERHLQKAVPSPARVMPELNTNAVSIVQILTPQFEIQAERTNGGWQLTKPLAYPAQSAAVNDLLAAVAELTPRIRISAEVLATRHSVSEEYGFEPPLATVVFIQDGEPHQLKLGKFTATGDGIYTELVGGAGVDIIDPDFYKKYVPHLANDWRNTNFVDLEGHAFDRLTVANGAQSFELQRDPANQTWRMVKPVLTRADSPKIEDLLKKLRGLSVSQFVTDDAHADLEGYGLQPAGLELNLGQGTNLVLSLQFGRSTTNDTAIYARHSGQSTIVLVPRESIAPWQKGYQEFRDRHLVRLTGNPPGVIQALGQDGELFTVESSTNGSWQVAAPFDFPADTNLMRAFLSNLTDMEVLRSNNEVAVKDTVLPDTDFPRYGLKTPSRIYILKSNASAAGVIAKLDFGLVEDGKIYARREDQPDETSVYAVKVEDFRKLPATGLQLHTRRIWEFLEDDVLSVSVREGGQTQKLVRNGPNKWTPGVGPNIYNELELEVGAEELGLLEAENWVERGDQDRAKYGFSDKSPRVVVDLQINGKPRTVTLDFGGRSPNGLRYGDVRMEDDQNWIFEFPALVHDRLAYYFRIAESPSP